jgi:DNA polymerase-1
MTVQTFVNPRAIEAAIRVADAQIHYVTDFNWLVTDGYMEPHGRKWFGPDYVGFDIETEAVFSPHDGEIACVQLALGNQCYVTHWHKDRTLAQVAGAEHFRALLEHPAVTKVIHNASFEQKWMVHTFGTDLACEPVHDTMAGEYILAEGSGFDETTMKGSMKQLSLGATVERRYQIEMDKDKSLVTSFRRAGTHQHVPAAKPGGVPLCEFCGEDAEMFVGSGKGIRNVCYGCADNPDLKRLRKREPIDQTPYLNNDVQHEALTERQLNYAAFDALWVLEVAQDQLAEMGRIHAQTGNDYRALLQLDSAAAEAMARMELCGLPVNMGELCRLDGEWQYALEYLDEDVREMLWMDGDEAGGLNINSGDQMVPRLSEFGVVIPSYETAELKRYKGVPIADKVIEYKQIKKLQSTYSSSFIKHVHPKTGRIHCSFNQFLTTTGRLSSSNPNLQNLPSRTPFGRQIRDCVEAPEGMTFVIADYSQIELRLIAEMYGDEAMITAFTEGKDLHAMMGAEIIGVPYEHFMAELKAGNEEYKDLRGNGKPANFGLGYGAGVPKLISIAWTQYDIAWDFGEASRIRNAYLNLWHGVQSYHKRIGREIENGQGPYSVVTQDGRVRRMPRHWYDEKTKKRKSCYSAALNHPIQGTSADMMKKVMVKVCREAQLVLQVHDELVLMCKVEDAEWVKYYLENVMREVGQTYFKQVPVEVDAKVSKTWKK